jgi:hypothetical protein
MLTAVATLLLAALPAAAVTQVEIAAAGRATSSGRTIVRRLASEGVAGRDNDTPGSARVQASSSAA